MEETDGDILPAPQEIVEGNVKKMIEYKYDEEGRKVKITRIFNIEKRKVPKTVATRKKWKKYGDAKNDNPHGPDPGTTFVGEEVFLTFTSNKEDLEQQDKENDNLSKLKGTSSIVKCRVCKGDHWTTMCPYKDSLQPLKDLEAKEKGPDGANTSELAAAAISTQAKLGMAQGPGATKYVPPSQRAGATADAKGTSMNQRRNDEAATLRVTNLSEEASESDLQELFRPFGPLTRVYLAKDKVTNVSKGFAFVSYLKRDDAARAAKALHGHGYDHLILNVEWARPSNN